MGLANGAGLKWKEGHVLSGHRGGGRGSRALSIRLAFIEGASARIRQGRAKG